MPGLKWLYPGMRVKRWVALMVLGLLTVGVGLTTLLNTRLLASFEKQLLQFVRIIGAPLSDWVLGIILILAGLILIALGMRFAIKSIVDSVLPDEDNGNLAEKVFRARSLQRGPKIVVIGGGTGLATLLRGLKKYTDNLTAVVTVADDGGSSGKIREELGILPPGDIRNTLVALADTEPLMEKLFQYRFSWGEGLEGHSFGNLFIAAMTDITGDFEEAIKAFGKVLLVKGRVIPSTLEKVRLKAKYTDGSSVVGESQIPAEGKQIASVQLLPGNAKAVPEALRAILQADLVVLGPGSLYTSIIPNLLVRQITQALARSRALRLYVCNVMTQPGETDKMSASDHVKALLDHSDNAKIIDYVIVNNARITSAQAEKYRQQKAFPIRADIEDIKRLGLDIIARPLLDEQDLVRHDSESLARELVQLVFKHKGTNGWKRRVADTPKN